MQNVFESLECRVSSCRVQLCEDLPNFDHEITSNVHRILSWVLQSNHQQLESRILSEYFLIDEMGNHFGRCHTNDLIVPHVCPLVLKDNPANNQLDYVREFGVDDCDQSRIYVSKVGRCHLGFDDGTSQEAFSTNDVLIEELDDHVLNVYDVHLVDYPIDTLPQELPHQLLVLNA